MESRVQLPYLSLELEVFDLSYYAKGKRLQSVPAAGNMASSLGVRHKFFLKLSQPLFKACSAAEPFGILGTTAFPGIRAYASFSALER